MYLSLKLLKPVKQTTTKDAIIIPGVKKTLRESLLDEFVAQVLMGQQCRIAFASQILQNWSTYISIGTWHYFKTRNNILLTRVIRSLSKDMIMDLTDVSSGSQLRWFSVDITKPEFQDNNIECLLKKVQKVFVYKCNSLYFVTTTDTKKLYLCQNSKQSFTL